MATVYSLICWGGKNGKAPTVSGATFTLTKHGMRSYTSTKPDSSTVQFVGGTPPGGASAGVTYYVKYLTADTFELYTNSDLTTGKLTTTSSGSGWVMKSGYYVGLTDTTRWQVATVEQIFDSLASWNSARGAVGTLSNKEVAEIGNAFLDYLGSGLSVNVTASSIVITSLVNGVRSDAYHQGIIDLSAGYCVTNFYGYGPALSASVYRVNFDGFLVTGDAYSWEPSAGIAVGKMGEAKNIIAIGRLPATSGVGIAVGSVGARVINCVSTKWSNGYQFAQYIAGTYAANNDAVANTVGFNATSSSVVYGFYYNNVSLGNTTNWYSTSGFEGASNNVGGTGEAWTTTGGTRVEVTETSPFSTTFAGYTSSPPDLRPASASSALYDAGLTYYAPESYDVSGADMPSYNNGGSEAYDIGAYEYDNGYGPRPASTTVTFSGVPAGSEIRVYDSGGAELAGVESSAANPVLTWTVASGAQRVVIINLAYRIKEFTYTNQSGAQTVPVQMDADQWYENP